jgi:heptosyltransferase-1
MFKAGNPANARILVVRLGAMGDIIHTLPAVASLKHSHPGCRLTWAVEPRWAPLLAENPFVDRTVQVRRDSPGRIFESLASLRAERYDFAVDFQGLIKSALVASLGGPERIFGFDNAQLRERAAGLFYSNKSTSDSAHIVDRNLDLAAAAGASNVLRSFHVPPGQQQGDLPPGDFVLASPLAGWPSKQWPIEHYRALAIRLRREFAVPLVLNGAPGAAFPRIPEALVHTSGVPGLIYATRRAAAVIGVDSGPLHLAAALGKPGVAIYGPTDPARNGPYCNTLRLLRSPAAVTSYKRGDAIDESMRQISPDEVFEALRAVFGCRVP